MADPKQPESPLPWKRHVYEHEIWCDIFDRFDMRIGQVGGEEDANHVVHAVNCFPSLLKAIEAGKAYAEALEKYASTPGLKASGQLVSGKDLDDLFETWMELTDAAIAKANP
jgi:hypothetical protein